MADIVLVHGAWHGSWCWRRVVPLLWLAGHRVVTVTLSGLGERAHQLSPEITLGTHVEDVVTAMRAEECSRAVLVGHSYGGLAVTGAADRLGDEVGRLVYVDAIVPLPGDAWSSRNPPEVQAARRAAIARHGFLPPPPPSAFGLTGADADWVERRQTPQPAGVSTTTRCTSTPRAGRPGRAPSWTARRRPCPPSSRRGSWCAASPDGRWSSWRPATTRWSASRRIWPPCC